MIGKSSEHNAVYFGVSFLFLVTVVWGFVYFTPLQGTSVQAKAQSPKAQLEEPSGTYTDTNMMYLAGPEAKVLECIILAKDPPTVTSPTEEPNGPQDMQAQSPKQDKNFYGTGTHVSKDGRVRPNPPVTQDGN